MAAAPGVALLPKLARADGFEGPASFPAADVLPPEALKGTYFEVTGDVLAQGYSNRYHLSTRYEDADVITYDLLIKREHEALALAYLETVKNTEAFSAGIVRALKSPYKAVKNLVTDPVDTLIGVPEGIWKFGRRIGEMVTGSRGNDEDNVAEELFGFSQIKRKVAFKLGVDVYTQNEMLQRAMNDVSYAGFAGGFVISRAMGGIPIGSIADRAMSAVEFTRTAAQVMRDNAPEDLRIRNRKSLKKMGMRGDDIDGFIDNDVFSPRHETIITLALEEMEGVGNRLGLIQRTHGVGTTVGALLTQRSIEMTRSYHATVAKIERIIDVGPHAGLLDENGMLMLVMPADRIHWTRWFSGAVDDLSFFKADGVSKRGIAIAGDISDKAAAEARKRGIMVKANSRSTLLPKPEEEWPEPEFDVDKADLPVPGSPVDLEGSVNPAEYRETTGEPSQDNNSGRQQKKDPPPLF